MNKIVDAGGARITRRNQPRRTGVVRPQQPKIPLPRKIQAIIKQREASGSTMTRQATSGSMASPQLAVIRNLPKVYSPLYEFSNLMLPRDLKTMNAWNRHFFACADAQTQTLTDNGFKYYWEINPEKDKIACFNPETEELEFQFGDLFIYDYDSDIHGPMIHFQTKKIDTMVTAQHDMWVDKLDWRDQSTWKNEWNRVKAKDVKKYQHRFRSTIKWSGKEPDSEYIVVAGELSHIKDYLQYLGLFLSEGWIEFSQASIPAPVKVGIGQCEYRAGIKEPKFDTVATIVKTMPFEVREVVDHNHKNLGGIDRFMIHGKDFGEHFLQYGRYSQDRFIPKWIKELKTEYLHLLLESMILGDGTVSYSDSYARIGTNAIRQVVYTTSSKQLADDVYEIAYKCGYVPTLFFQEKEGNLKDLYLVKINDSTKGHYPVLKSNAKDFKSKEKQEVPYKGKVYCFHVPPHNLFVIRRNGKVTITGNTNPVVRNAITLHATLPISKFNITCEDPKVKEFFEDMFEKIGFKGVLMGLALEFYKLGEAFPYLELDEDNGIWDYVFLHNPDFIRVKTSALARYPVIYLVPDDSLRRLVQGRTASDAELRAQLPAETAYHVMRGQDIPLPNFNVSHLKMLNSEYDIRGTSIITSCYKDLMLYDKLREMQYAQADGMINPITLVKLGDPNGQWRPSDEDVRAFQNIMEESQYDPDFKIVTHGAVNIERIGYSGHTLDISQMWEAIQKNLYTGLLAPEAILNGEGPNYCFVNADNTQIYTNHGYLTLDEMVEYDLESEDLHKNLTQKIKYDDLKIACFNPETEHIEFHSPTEVQVFNYDSDVDGDLVHFHTKKIDLLVTPNHKMWVNGRRSWSGWKDEWYFERADQVPVRVRRFRSIAKWEGTSLPETIRLAGQSLSYEDYLKFVGYFVSEGYVSICEDKEYYRSPQYRVGITQNEYRKEGSVVSETFPVVKSLMDRLPFNVRPSYDDYGQKEFIIYNKDLACYMGEHFGVGAINKRLTPDLKNLSPKYLRILLDAIMLGDGHTSTSSDHGRSGKNSIEQHQFFSVSKRLADDVYEIVFKLGYAPIMRLEKRGEERGEEFKNQKDIWWVEWTESDIGNFPTLDTRSKIYPNGAVSRVSYRGKVFCFTVPYNLFVVRRNGKQSIQGNSTASIGLEVLRARYDRFREQLAEWIEKKVMEPICKLQDFYITKGGSRKLIVPKVQWNRLNLRDMDSYVATLVGMSATPEAPGKVSDQTICESLGLDYEEEKKRMREEMRDRSIQAKEQQAVLKMSIEELQTIDPEKPIVDTHEDEEPPVSPEQQQMPGGMPPGGPGGMPGGGGMPPGAPKPPGGPPIPGGPPGPGAPLGSGGAPPTPPAGPTPGAV
jgi:hypothetical protein